ncbi:MAG: acyl carrier protein [Thalassovita sp.]|nr:acyl carrier protein [Thalassovita sp.]
MTNDDIKVAFLEELIKVAPDIDPADVGGNDQLQDDLELDSMDFLTLVTALHKRLGVNIPEEHYLRIETLDKAVAYLSERMA